MDDNEALRTVREFAGLNQREAAQKLGIHPMTWAKRELGLYTIPEGFLPKVRREFTEEIRERVPALEDKPEEVAIGM